MAEEIHFRSLADMTLVGVESETGVTEVMVTNRPDKLGDGAMERIVVMPQRALASLVTRDIENPPKDVLTNVANRLLGEIKAECREGDACPAEVQAFDKVEAGIGVRVLGVGVVCAGKVACSQPCLLGLRPQL